MDLPVLADGEYPIGHAAVEVRSRCLTPKDLAAMQQPRARVLREGRPVQGPTNLQSRFQMAAFRSWVPAIKCRKGAWRRKNIELLANTERLEGYPTEATSALPGHTLLIGTRIKF